VSDPEARIAEFLRQHNNLLGVDPEELSTVYTDPEGAPATLRVSDLRTMLAEAKQWHDTYQQAAGAFDEFLGDLLELLPGAEDTGSDAYDQIPRGIKALHAELESATASVVALSGRVDTLTARCEQQERDHAETVAEVERVRELHKKFVCGCGADHGIGCHACGSTEYPCRTIRALDGSEQS
jgi:hypothetical protein